MPFVCIRCISELSKPEFPRFITRRSPGIVYSYNRLAIVLTFDEDDMFVVCCVLGFLGCNSRGSDK